MSCESDHVLPRLGSYPRPQQRAEGPVITLRASATLPPRRSSHTAPNTLTLLPVLLSPNTGLQSTFVPLTSLHFLNDTTMTSLAC